MTVRNLHFVYLGNSLPPYVAASIDLSIQFGGVSVNLIGNRELGKRVTNNHLNFISLEDFYSAEKFSDAAAKVMYSSKFRNGFWLKSLERLFVLEQFMLVSKEPAIFHAELDQLLFSADKLISALERGQRTGIFVPFHNSQYAIASVLYCNDFEAISSLTTLACEGDYFSNEMELISRWASIFPEKAFALPTVADEYALNRVELPGHIETLSVEETGGFVDAAQLGQWVAGIDPRNVPILKRPVTKFVDNSDGDLLTKEQLSELRFGLTRSSNSLTLTYGTFSETQVYNLHLHSKIHQWLLANPANLEELLAGAGQQTPRAIPGTRKMQVEGFFGERWSGFLERLVKILRSDPGAVTRYAIRAVSKVFRWRPSSSPFISGDSFRAMATAVWEREDGVGWGQSRYNYRAIVFCQADLLASFTREVMPHLDTPIVLLLGNSDVNFSRRSFEGLDRSLTPKIYCQNLTEEVEGVEVLPIGLENRWWNNHGRLKGFSRPPAVGGEKVFRILWGFNVQTNVMERSRAAQSLASCASADKIEDKVSPEAHQNLLRKYAFVASPPGNGLDTHRTWEAMYLGCVPIVPRSYMASRYEDLGLPIWVVEDFSVLQDSSEDELKAVFLSLQPKFDSQALRLSFWEQAIRATSREQEP